MSQGSTSSREAIQQAAQLLQRGAVTEARNLLTGVLAREPGNSDALSILGVALAQAQDFAGAADVLRRAVNMNPRHAAAQLNLGHALKRMGRLAEAADTLSKAAALRPDSLPAQRLLASTLLDLERHEAAAEALSQVIRLSPNDALALNDRGLAYLALGQAQRALADFEAALRLKPDAALVHGNRGLALQRLGRADDARQSFATADRLDPDNPSTRLAAAQELFAASRYAETVAAVDALLGPRQDFAPGWALRGDALRAQGQFEGAVASYTRALTLNPGDYDAMIGIGLVHVASGNLPAAVETFNAAAPLRPERARAYLGRAQAARGLGNFPAALYDLDLALKFEPDNTDALSLRAGILRDLNRRAEALDDLERALRVQPANWNFHNNRGVLLDEFGRPEEALLAFERSLELNPNNPDAFQNIGTALLALGRGNEAVAKYDRALAVRPHDIDVLNAKGAVLMALRRFGDALQSFEQAAAAQPQSAISHFHRSLALLAQGKLREGFEAYEWRRRGERPFAPVAQFPQPEVEVGQDIRGKTLLLHSEQGMGDIIQFARFAFDFADRGAKVVLATYPPLVSLLKTLGRRIEVVPPEGPAPAFDLTCPLMSAPHKLGMTLETIPAPIPYLSAAPALTGVWRERLSADAPGLRVGVAWSGNPQYANDWTRSIAFEKLRAIMDVPGATFVNVQRDLRVADEAAFAASSIVDYRLFLTDFAQTAALVSELDVVVTVDTALGHLAGALGKPVWILLSAVSDWRWLEKRSDSPWYPTVRLFRQRTLGDWEPVFAEVKAGLARLAASRQ